MTNAHRVKRLWIRPDEAGNLSEREELKLTEGKGVEGDHTFGRMRHVTIVFEDDWNMAVATLGAKVGSVDPAGRRANVLVEGSGGGAWIGRTIELGDARVEIKGETAPCPVMERAAPGMMVALQPETRAGVWGRVVRGGALRVGDVLKEPDAP